MPIAVLSTTFTPLPRAHDLTVHAMPLTSLSRNALEALTIDELTEGLSDHPGKK